MSAAAPGSREAVLDQAGRPRQPWASRRQRAAVGVDRQRHPTEDARSSRASSASARRGTVTPAGRARPARRRVGPQPHPVGGGQRRRVKLPAHGREGGPYVVALRAATSTWPSIRRSSAPSQATVGLSGPGGVGLGKSSAGPAASVARVRRARIARAPGRRPPEAEVVAGRQQVAAADDQVGRLRPPVARVAVERQVGPRAPARRRRSRARPAPPAASARRRTGRCRACTWTWLPPFGRWQG